MAVYFITAREIGRVKIGFSDSPRSRFMKMRTDSPVALELERLMDGGIPDERGLHERFKAFRLGGEWFQLSPDIVAFMDTLPAVAKESRRPSIQQMLISAAGISTSYASQAMSAKCPSHRITIPMAIAVYRDFGERLGPIEHAEPSEIDVLEKFCGRMRASSTAKAA